MNPERTQVLLGQCSFLQREIKGIRTGQSREMINPATGKQVADSPELKPDEDNEWLQD